MNKKTYATPTVTVTAIETQGLMAASPSNDISEDKFVFDPAAPTEEISGDEAMSKADIFIWE